MWFSNALVYRCTSSATLNTYLEEERLKGCPPHARFIYGWLPVMQDLFVHEIAGACLFSLGKEERILPKNVIHRILNEQILDLETQRGYPVKRAEKAQLAEELEFQLLPKAFCVQKKLPALFDTLNQRLIINTSSPTQAAQLLALLRKSVPNTQIEPLTTIQSVQSTLTSWVTAPESLPADFSLASYCLLTNPNDEKKRFQCKGYELPAEEVSQLISQGLEVLEVELIWQDRISFILTHTLGFKKIRPLDYLVDAFQEIRDLEEEQAQQDASLALLTGEWRSILNDLNKVFFFEKADESKTPLENIGSLNLETSS
jgi:recombination associated protein RdgC